MIAIALAAVALFGVAIAAFALRAFLAFAKGGPAVAQQAYEHGESVRAWWNASPVCNTSDQPRDGERYAIGGRSDDEVGDEFVEERAVYAR